MLYLLGPLACVVWETCASNLLVWSSFWNFIRVSLKHHMLNQFSRRFTQIIGMNDTISQGHPEAGSIHCRRNEVISEAIIK